MMIFLKRKNSVLRFAVGAFAFLLISACKKVVTIVPNKDNGDTFLYTYGSANQWNTNVIKSDSGYVLVGMWRSISKVGYNGDLLWQIEEEGFNYATTFRNNGIRLKDGSYLINCYADISDVTHISETGQILYAKPVVDALYTYNSRLLEGENGNAYLSYLSFSGTSLGGNIVTFDTETGDSISNYSYQSNLFSPSRGRPSQFYVYRATASNYWVVGYDNVNLRDTVSGENKLYGKTYILKLEPKNNGIEQVKILSEGELVSEELCDYMATKSNQLIAVTAVNTPFFINAKSNNRYFDVRLIDEELNEVWKTNVTLPAQKINPMRMCETENGDIVIVGNCVLPNSKYITSFVVRLSSAGVLLNYKIFEEYRDFYLADIITDGDYFVFTGWSRGFGLGLEGQKRILLKTDSDFNY